MLKRINTRPNVQERLLEIAARDRNHKAVKVSAHLESKLEKELFKDTVAHPEALERNQETAHNGRLRQDSRKFRV